MPPRSCGMRRSPSASSRSASSGPPVATMRPSTRTCTTSGVEVVEQALVVGDEQDAELGPVVADLADALGDDPQRVDVEAGVGLVEDRELGLEDRHLQDLVALLLAAREALVEVAVGERRVHVEALRPLHDRQPQLEHRQVDALAGRQRLAQEVEDRDARDLLRVLEAEEHARPCPARRCGQSVMSSPLKQDAARGDLVAGLPSRVLASVDLPEPFGPIRAWTSPAPTVRSTPAGSRRPSTRDVEVVDLEEGRLAPAMPASVLALPP